jgi:hypothetical protein
MSVLARVCLVALALAGFARASAPLDNAPPADLDPANDDVVAPPDIVVDCDARLAAAGVKFKRAEVPLRQKRRGTYTCGTEQAVVYSRGPEGIRWNVAPLVSCRLALGIARFERLVQEEAQRHFGKRVSAIEQGGTYNCRKMTRFNLVSEHSYANAVDIRAFKLEDGRRVTVLRDFGAVDREPATAKQRFLRDLARRSYDEGVFSVVLTPYWDALHRDHLHLDMARYRVDGTR